MNSVYEALLARTQSMWCVKSLAPPPAPFMPNAKMMRSYACVTRAALMESSASVVDVVAPARA